MVAVSMDVAHVAFISYLHNNYKGAIDIDSIALQGTDLLVRFYDKNIYI